MKPQSLSDFAGESRASGNQINYKNCPVCGSTSWKLYVNPETGAWYCFAGGHSAGGKVEAGSAMDLTVRTQDMMAKLGAAAGRAIDRMIAWPEVELPPFTQLSVEARAYMENRGFDQDVVEKHGIVEWEDKGRVLIPYFDRSGRIIYWNARTYRDHTPKYLAAPGRHPLYIAQWTQAPRRVIIVEGTLDAIALQRVMPAFQVVALGGKSVPKYLMGDLREQTSRSILKRPIIYLDDDAMAGAIKLRDNIGGAVFNCRLDPADAVLYGMPITCRPIGEVLHDLSDDMAKLERVYDG